MTQPTPSSSPTDVSPPAGATAGTRLPPLAQVPPQVHQLDDYAALAEPRMAPDAWAHVNGVAGAGITAQANRAAYARWWVLPRVLQPLADASTAVTLLGQRLAHPFVLAPVAYQRLAHPQGELASAEAAMALGGGCVVSTQASETLEDVARAARRGLGWPESPGAQTVHGGEAASNQPGMPWFQIYFQRELADTLDLVRRAEHAGYTALVVTVDAPLKLRRGFVLPPDVDAANLRQHTRMQDPVPSLADSPLFSHPLLAAAPGWADVAWLRAHTTLPIYLKGILTAHDARLALEQGIDGLIVSNHGGRVQDGLPPTLAMLPAVVQAVRDWAQAQGTRCPPVLVDGGIRSGTDAFKAICLGASAVLIGRPYIHALATAGALGVAHAIHLLRAELELCMATAGCAQLAQAGPHLLMPA
ncbi:hypothetical protein CCO03_11830 [Comamonas serinivorans]|uniref:FMN hydroxy acid dehydrogenase domain-containing protein n=1 Tax=Comamonas serinivorans TaxID=1082851 RepID=A0A1Y0ENT1_9BURK|nr:alpha-hydroxy acid oxidase [Comamonas serinivorans]ARU05277.1 hypothetical protein CCO03_11830 [Comamonas serinivorans]